MGINKIMKEESGTFLGSLVTRPDLSGCLFPDRRTSRARVT